MSWNKFYIEEKMSSIKHKFSKLFYLNLSCLFLNWSIYFKLLTYNINVKIIVLRFIDKPPPEKCLVFEDAPNGVAAALSADMQVIMIPDENVPIEMQTQAHVKVSSLAEAPLERFGLPAMKT